jgi:hypothetical protein
MIRSVIVFYHIGESICEMYWLTEEEVKILEKPCRNVQLNVSKKAKIITAIGLPEMFFGG